MTTLAPDPCKIHRTRRCGNSDTAGARVQILLWRMPGAVTAFATVLRSGRLSTHCHAAVLYLIVTMQTLHFVLRNMDAMQLFGLSVFCEPGHFVMTGKTTVFRNVSFSSHHICVTGIAFHVEPLYVTMIESQVCSLDGFFRDVMAKQTACRACSRLLIFKMTQKTSGGCYRYMTSLNNL